MRFLPIILFLIYVYLEVSFFVVVANAIGVLLALFCIIATSIIGLSIVKTQGLKNFVTMQQKMASNENPTSEVVKSTSLLIAGFFLLIPGFLTDIIGALLLLPPIQQIFAKFIVPKVSVTTAFTTNNSHNNAANDDIIEGQFERKDDE